MADPLTRADGNAAEEVDHVRERIRTVLVPAENPRVVRTLVRARS